ncbi:MAG TPA: hypothetical protein VFM38_00385 [Candidatus Limnocylindrales bacterium]|nr:hypothetical protein [Candidatus Limnocylindrales bacterium]
MRKIVGLAVASLLVAACGGSSGGAAPAASPTASTAAIASTGPSLAAASAKPSVAAPSPTPIPGCLPGCVTPDLDRPGDLDAGDYTTRHWFGEQFTITVPAGWTSFEDSTGEFGLQPKGPDDRKLLFWLDVYPVHDDGMATPIEGFDGTGKSLIAWVEANPNVKVIEKATGRMGDLEATTLELGRSPKAKNYDPGCPVEGRPCVGLFSFPQWGQGFYSVGGPFHIKVYAADVTWGGENHAIYAVIDANDDSIYAAIAPAATSMIEGARLPLGVEQGV